MSLAVALDKVGEAGILVLGVVTTQIKRRSGGRLGSTALLQDLPNDVDERSLKYYTLAWKFVPL